MPVDLRKVIFSNEETQAAMVNYCLRNDIKMPDATISSIEINWQTELTSDMHFESSSKGEDGNVVTFSNEMLAAALILYCHLKGDPLPREGQKVLEPVADGISLTTRHAWGDNPSDDHPGLAIHWMDSDPVDTAEPKPNKPEPEPKAAKDARG